jgi:hypothetical protein
MGILTALGIFFAQLFRQNLLAINLNRMRTWKRLGEFFKPEKETC